MLSDRSCVCEWCNQYYMTAEEREYFWERIQCRPCQLHDNSRHSHQKGNNLYNMKSYVWPMGTEVFFFKIGLNPLRSFQVEIILEKENQTEYVGLDGTTVNELFSTIKLSNKNFIQTTLQTLRTLKSVFTIAIYIASR